MAAEKTYDYTRTLRKPLEYEGKTYNELNFNFSELTGRDLNNVLKELLDMRHVTATPALDCEVQVRIAAIASVDPAVPADVLVDLPLNDYTGILQKAENFML